VSQILANALSNAAKYGGGRVSVSARRVELVAQPTGAAVAAAGPAAAIVIEITDDGPGLRGKSTDALFADFDAITEARRALPVDRFCAPAAAWHEYCACIAGMLA
jgi:K+-sensing histidine kinase KdpD